ncbi:MAG: hypothetical protein EWV53_19805 [Microcystis panniformis Mp_MB_F_20051200_S9]|uniref:Uncharacterized protein n=1 Tax=Microcystis panniformis Mp_MB_F_20051200_S9 TaxID=2486223 RepID=A0A552PLW9_9CHRO|nr:MAG: hypothetical protein EWV43_24405 [Microcystis panniformis Mp_MB_F_20080800_S26D]TRV50044.1 MAG: hypothetical protein EWV42_12075 [Microcystis panniformis Mp_GB_SS_20050300_S99D]TRV53021.1 MAG: hypothetical protein EWV87_03925 [Microcystis panniformis Mp_GB_SS_20050300_S99]TRV57993.1 MAG: hypothetical protein EWV53_19805 [Microcystis panniformis Mp_MB_F_20051200_S9]TRV59056.1 MAG: hypothetical protein EWV86_18540 [Microcystis panniformis Mp_MB_F_20051200_S9D]TRV61692.1 MAG: hypothetical
MTFNPVSSDPFGHYFYKRAELADEMILAGYVVEARILATAYLDALAEIWLHDFPNIKKKLEREFGGKVPGSIRLARFLKQFAVGDARVSKVAVICFAEDWKKHRPQDTDIANRLLNRRINNNRHQLPSSYLDLSRDDLAQECPELNSRSDLYALAEEYEYGAILYSFYRCPLAHVATHSKRTHGFARREEVMYYWSDDDDDSFTIGFGPNLATCWLRNLVSNYVLTCQQFGITPANSIDAGISHENRFRTRWSLYNSNVASSRSSGTLN